MPKTRRNKKRAGKLKNFKMKQQHKVYYIFGRGRMEKYNKMLDEHNIKQEILKESAQESMKKKNVVSDFIGSIFKPKRDRGHV